MKHLTNKEVILALMTATLDCRHVSDVVANGFVVSLQLKHNLADDAIDGVQLRHIMEQAKEELIQDEMSEENINWLLTNYSTYINELAKPITEYYEGEHGESVMFHLNNWRKEAISKIMNIKPICSQRVSVNL